MRDNIIWNFYEATTVNFGSRNMMGQVIAPYAHVTSQGNIDGSIFARSLTTTGEVHLPGYNGLFQNGATSAESQLPGMAGVAIPEPGSMTLAAFAGLLLMRRKRSA